MYSDSRQLGVIEIGLIHAPVLTAITYTIGYSTDAQVNPAVTIALLVARKIGGKEAALYICVNSSMSRSIKIYQKSREVISRIFVVCIDYNFWPLQKFLY